MHQIEITKVKDWTIFAEVTTEYDYQEGIPHLERYFLFNEKKAVQVGCFTSYKKARQYVWLAIRRFAKYPDLKRYRNLDNPLPTTV